MLACNLASMSAAVVAFVVALGLEVTSIDLFVSKEKEKKKNFHAVTTVTTSTTWISQVWNSHLRSLGQFLLQMPEDQESSSCRRGLVGFTVRHRLGDQTTTFWIRSDKQLPPVPKVNEGQLQSWCGSVVPSDSRSHTRVFRAEMPATGSGQLSSLCWQALHQVHGPVAQLSNDPQRPHPERRTAKWTQQRLACTCICLITHS